MTQVRTLAGTGEARFSGDGGPASEASIAEPFGVVRGPDGAIWFCDLGNHRIRRIAPDGTVATVVGRGEAGNDGDGGHALAAAITEPYELRFNAAGDLFFVDMKAHVVRAVSGTDHTIRTVAGTGEAGFDGDDGPATAARMRQPHSIEFGPYGGLYVADIGNHRIRRIDLDTGTISTFGGTGGKNATQDGASLDGSDLFGPRAIAFDANGDMVLALREGNAVWRIDMRSRTLQHVAGTGEFGYDGDGGPAVAAKLAGPKGVAINETGDIYLADTESHTIRVIRGDGRIETVLGDGTTHDGPDGDPFACGLARPHGVFAAGGEVWIGDSDNHRVRHLA